MLADRTELRRRVQWYRSGEIVIVARVPRDRAAAQQTLHVGFQSALRRHAEEHVAAHPAALRSSIFNAPGADRSLVFFFQRLAQDSPVAVKAAIQRVHERIADVGGGEIEAIGAMPHWHTRAHEAYSGGSPGSLPRPVYPDQVPPNWNHRFYQPVNPRLDLEHETRGADHVSVAVLDTRVDFAAALRRAEDFRTNAHNEQLIDTIEWLRQRPASIAATDDDEFRSVAEQREVAPAQHDTSEPPPYHMADHALFVAGLIHGIAPEAPLALEPVLDDMGVGNLWLLLAGLQRVLSSKQPTQPLIVNLSLGFLPHPARLPAAWYGLPRPHDRHYLHAQELFNDAYDRRWLLGHRAQVDHEMDLLQIGLRELGTYLTLNNCLVVAAAGNDSYDEVGADQARMEPRLPARFDTVLGVAATTSNPHHAAPYSNVGDERELGDHVATFGGGVSGGIEPEDGVIGIYSGELPDRRPNETGWAYWSGTSFATAIVSGIAANLWTHRLKHDASVAASSVLADLHAEALDHGPYVPSLRTPAIEVRGRWR